MQSSAARLASSNDGDHPPPRRNDTASPSCQSELRLHRTRPFGPTSTPAAVSSWSSPRDGKPPAAARPKPEGARDVRFQAALPSSQRDGGPFLFLPSPRGSPECFRCSRGDRGRCSRDCARGSAEARALPRAGRDRRGGRRYWRRTTPSHDGRKPGPPIRRN